MSHIKKYKLIYDDCQDINFDIVLEGGGLIDNIKSIFGKSNVNININNTSPKITLSNYGKEIPKDLMNQPKDKALIDIEKLNNVSGKPRVTVEQRSSYKKFLQWAYRSFKVMAGTTATIISFGAAGDTLTDTTFLIIDTAFLTSNVGSLFITEFESTKKWITDIYNIEWTGNPENVKSDTELILDNISKNQNAVEVYGEICNKYLTIIDSIAAMFGSLIAALIPDDGGASRIIIELIISQGMTFIGQTPFIALKSIYDSIPSILQEILKTKKNLSAFFLQMLSYLKALVPSKNDTVWERVKKFGKRTGFLSLFYIIPGVNLLVFPLMPVINITSIASEINLVNEQIHKFIDSMIAPHADKYAELILKIIPMVFATTIIFERCGNKIN